MILKYEEMGFYWVFYFLKQFFKLFFPVQFLKRTFGDHQIHWFAFMCRTRQK